MQNALFVKDANRHIKARKEEDIRKEWKQLRRANILGNQAPPTSTQPNKSPGNSPLQDPSTVTEDVPEALFWVDSTGMR